MDEGFLYAGYSYPHTLDVPKTQQTTIVLPAGLDLRGKWITGIIEAELPGYSEVYYSKAWRIPFVDELNKVDFQPPTAPALPAIHEKPPPAPPFPAKGTRLGVTVQQERDFTG